VTWTEAFLLLLYAGVLAAAAAYGFARSKYSGLLTDEIRQREPIVERARKEEQAKLEEVRKEADEALKRLRQEAEEARRFADNARSALEVARKEASMEAQTFAMRAVEEATVAAKLEAKRDIEERYRDREQEIAKREGHVAAKEGTIKQLESNAIKLVDDRRAKLEALAGLSGQDAKKKMTDELLDSVRRDAAREAKAIEDTAKDEAEKKAHRIIGIAIQRYAGEHVQDRAMTSVHLPSDDMKGRLIGREGRNIRALQESCGVDFIIDDTPETVVISGFDPVRREVARIAIEALVADGRIQPSRIEEVVARAKEQVEKGVSEYAEQAFLELGVTRVHPEITRLVGLLKFRYSYAQNVLKHSIECGYIAGMMAAELGQDELLARRAGLLHDIGKAVSHEQEGGHAVIGGQYARKYGEDPTVANAIACHHDDEPTMTIIGNLVTAADALSGARPGARREVLEGYVQRLQDLERISTRFAGVERAFAIQAGREVRVMVEPSEVSDAEAALLAREISKRIEDELSYPGQIRVTVVRETRAVDYAK
jgi:ribonuclease Y